MKTIRNWFRSTRKAAVIDATNALSVGWSDPGADPAHEWTKSIPESVLDEAARIIAGNRENDYGPAERNLGRIADMWSAYLGTTIDARDVAWMMVQLKASRDRHNRKRDNLVDGAGYLGLLE